MKYLIIILILITLVMPATAQEPDYDQWLISVDGLYYRVDHTPVRVCAGSVANGWHDLISQAVYQFNQVVRTRFVTTNCDIVINTAPVINCAGSGVGCAGRDPANFTQIAIYLADTAPFPVLLHELLHAFGVWLHPEGEISVLQQAWHTLTAFDVAILRYLYRQPAVSSAAIEANHAAVAAYFAPQCAWIEAHRDTLSEDGYARYRCQ